MIAEIIPRLRSIRKLEILDYAIPAGLVVQPGMTVTIPFRSTSIFGVVVKLKTTSEAKRLREVESVVKQEASLSPLQISLVFELAKRTGSSLSVALLTVLQQGQLTPARQRTIKPTIDDQRMSTTSTRTTVNRQRLPLLKKTLHRVLASSQPLVVRYSHSEDVVAMVSLLTSQPGTHLILVPQDELLEWWRQKLHHRTPLVFSSTLKRTTQRQLVEQLRLGQAQIVIGTRGAIFLPPDHFTTITVIDEEHQAYHQEQNPRLQTVSLAVWLSQQLSIPCALFSRSPRIASAYSFPLLDITQPLTAPPQVIDLNAWREHGGRGWFTPDFLSWIQTHLPAILLFNRKGQFRWLRCQDCQNIIPIGPVTDCPKCHSIRLRPSGQGNQQLEEVLRTLLPQHRIAHWDADSPTPPPADILLTTNFAFNRVDWNQFQGVGVISVDHQLAIPDFRSNERVLAQLTQIIRSQRPVCIQTSSPDHPVMQAAISQNFPGFYDYELSIRKKLKYPPFGVMVEYIDIRSRKSSLQKFPTLSAVPPPAEGVVLDILE